MGLQEFRGCRRRCGHSVGCPDLHAARVGRVRAPAPTTRRGGISIKGLRRDLFGRDAVDLHRNVGLELHLVARSILSRSP